MRDYPHLDGALYRRVIFENEFVGSIASYLVVLNHLPVCALNAPLLLLAKGKKLLEFCRWLLKDANGLTLEEKRTYQLYLVQYNLIPNQEVTQKMKYELFGPPNFEWVFEGLALRSVEERQQFFQLALKRISEATSPEEATQRLLNANSLEEATQRLLHANSPKEATQKLLHANSPVEAALKLLETQEQLQEFLERIQQRGIGVPVEQTR